MSNDERMIRVENACMEQAIRIEALEKRTYNLPKTDAYNRLEQRIEELESKVQWCESEIGAIYSADENWQKTWGQWREKHNELCDVVDAMLTYVRPNMQADYHKAVRLARIDTGDTEAQDDETREAVSRNVSEMGSPSKESQDAEGASKTVEEEDGGNKSREAEICGVDGRGEPNDNVATGDGNSSVDAIMGELRKVIPRALYENRVTMAESESDDVFYAEEWELPTEAVLREVRPHIERLVRKRKYWINEAMDALDVKNREPSAPSALSALLAERDKERQRAEKAELKEQLGETQYACDGAEDERDKALAEVVRLRDLLKAMPHLGEAHEGYVQAVNEALAEGNDYG